MKRMIIAAALGILAAPAAQASADLVQVPAACGTQAAIKELLSVNMPTPETIGKGGNSRGEDLVVPSPRPRPATGRYWRPCRPRASASSPRAAAGGPSRPVPPRLSEPAAGRARVGGPPSKRMLAAARLSIDG